MRLENCKLGADWVVSAPICRREPEDDWLRDRDSGAIPLSLFALYTRASYLSFGSAPSFLRDDENLLFSYFGMVLRGVKKSLIEADEERRLFLEAHAHVYEPGKKARGESWDPSADDRARRHFRHFILSLQAVLDGLADMTGLLLTGLVPGLQLGRAQFSRLETWLGKPLPVPGLIVNPQEHHLRGFHAALRPLVHPSGPARDWVRMMRLLRNKGAHLGDAVFRYVVLHDESARFYTFIPREWPHIWERHIKPIGASSPSDPHTLSKFFGETLMHQDIVSWVHGLRSRVHEVIDAGFTVLDQAYETFKSFAVNSAALDELKASSEAYAFEYFPPSGEAPTG